jgi:DNA-directed RNA polymerase I subunit RPA12
MDPPEGESVVCSSCPYSARFDDLGNKEVCTRSLPKSKPNWIKDEDDDREKLDKNAKIDETCPKCGNPEMFFYTMQLRSVDEGQTVFYECPSCEHVFSDNN